MVVVALSCSSSKSNDPLAFCDALRATSAITGSVSSVDLDQPDSVQDAVDEIEALADLAPDEIASEMDVLSAIYSEVLTVLADTPRSAREDALRDLQGRLDEAFEPADALDGYAATSCGVEFEAPPEPTPTPTPLDIDD